MIFWRVIIHITKIGAIFAGFVFLISIGCASGNGGESSENKVLSDIQEPDFGNRNQNTGKLTIALRKADTCRDIAEKWRQMMINTMVDRLRNEWNRAIN